VSALKVLGCRDIVVYEVEYDDPSIGLFGWDALVLDPCAVSDIVMEFASKEKLVLRRHKDFAGACSNVRSHHSCFSLLVRSNEVFEVSLREGGLDELILCLKKFEAELDRRKIRLVYVADDQAEKTFQQHGNAWALFKRPFFTKEEVMHRTLQGKPLPRKSTRHLFPLRPLRIDIDFILLKEDIDIGIKNKLLQARLDWCLENNMVRYYPESVLILSD